MLQLCFPVGTHLFLKVTKLRKNGRQPEHDLLVQFPSNVRYIYPKKEKKRSNIHKRR